MTTTEFPIGSLVWFRGLFTEQYHSLRGVIEDYNAPLYGVRLENGSFHWAFENQLLPRTTRTTRDHN